MTTPAQPVQGLGAGETKIGDTVVQFYRPWWSEIFAGMAFAAGALILYAAIDFAIDGKLDLRRLRGNGR